MSWKYWEAKCGPRVRDLARRQILEDRDSFFLSIYVEIMEALDIFEGPPFLD
jgi:hypothetical protein